jgi:hypothetical protein
VPRATCDFVDATQPGQLIATAELDPQDGYLVRVIEYNVPDWEANGTGELIVRLTTITDPHDARPTRDWDDVSRHF